MPTSKDTGRKEVIERFSEKISSMMMGYIQLNEGVEER